MSLLDTFVQSARDAYPDAAPTPLLASGLVNSLLQDYPFEDGERAWVSCDLEADFVLPCQRDMLYLVLSTLTKNALHALHGRSEQHLRITLERGVPDAAGHPVCRHWAGHRAGHPGAAHARAGRLAPGQRGHGAAVLPARTRIDGRVGRGVLRAGPGRQHHAVFQIRRLSCSGALAGMRWPRLHGLRARQPLKPARTTRPPTR